MKKILAMLLVLAMGLIPVLAMAEEVKADDWKKAALDAGRCAILEMTWGAPEELKDYKLVTKEQNTDGERVDISLYKGETDLLGISAGVSESADAMYLLGKPLGDAPIALSSGDLTALLQQLLDMLAESGAFGDAEVADEIDALDEFAEEVLVPTFDPTDLNLTPLLSVVPYLSDCVRVEDVEDYEVDLQYFSAERDETGKLKLAEKNLPVLSVQLPQPVQVKSEAIITLTADDLQILVNALCATVVKNPSLAMMFEDSLDDVTGLLEKFIDHIAEDLVIQVGMNEDGSPVFATLTVGLKMGLKTRVYAFNAMTAEDIETETTLVSMNGMYSDNREEEFHYLYDLMFIANGKEEFTFLSTLGDVDEEYLSTLATLSVNVPNENENRADLTVALLGKLGGEEFNFELGAGAEGKRDGIDYTITVNSNIADTVSGATLASVSGVETTGDPEPNVDLSGAIYPARLGEAGMKGFLTDTLSSVFAWANEISAAIESAE